MKIQMLLEGNEMIERMSTMTDRQLQVMQILRALIAEYFTLSAARSAMAVNVGRCQ